MSNWTLFSNHGHVLVCLARDSEARLRDVAADVGITERAVQKIVRDLQDNGMVGVTKHGRRNRYRIHYRKPLRHDLEAHCTLGDLLDLVINPKSQTGLLAPARSIEPVAVNIEPAEPAPARPEADKHVLTSSEPVKSEPAKVKAAEPDIADSTERQQGSLF
jgi:hypothetical protein